MDEINNPGKNNFKDFFYYFLNILIISMKFHENQTINCESPLLLKLGQTNK